MRASSCSSQSRRIQSRQVSGKSNTAANPATREWIRVESIIKWIQANSNASGSCAKPLNSDCKSSNGEPPQATGGKVEQGQEEGG